MAYSTDIDAARRLAERQHAHQADKAGLPYIDHPRRVAERLPSPEAQVVGWLHDTVEDTPLTLGEIEARFGPETAAAVDAVSRRPGEAWEAYLARVKANPVARQVKISDLIDNSNLSRIPRVTLRDIERQAKYNRALMALMGAEANQAGRGPRLAVLFPGIGYHCDKPLLYHSARLARAAGWQVLPVPYSGFPEKVRGDAEKLRQCCDLAWQQARALLSEVRWADWADILFIGKSIGTLVAARYAREQALEARSILFTPLVETFQYARGSAIAFHGTADPWADTRAVVAACRAQGIPLCLTEGANHSLETGDPMADLQTLLQTMARVKAFLGEAEPRG